MTPETKRYRELAPVALFVFARPLHTLRTLNALSRNKESHNSTLYIFSDGPKKDASVQECRRIGGVREVIRQRRWCGRVQIVEEDSNKGLARSIVDGVSQVCQAHGRVIVLEDDLETSPGFLRYMNNALDLYQDRDRVMQISGFNVRNWPWSPETGFLRVSTSWGWATWQRAWRHYDDNASSLLRRVEISGREAFDLDGHSFHFDELERNAQGELNTWAVRWYASLFLRGGLVLYPRQTLVRNIGFDGSGVNCHDDETAYHRRLRLARRKTVARRPLEETPAYLKAMQHHFDELKRLWTGTRLRDRVVRKAKTLIQTLQGA